MGKKYNALLLREKTDKNKNIPGLFGGAAKHRCSLSANPGSILGVAKNFFS